LALTDPVDDAAMRHLAIAALFLAAACGGKSSSSTVPEEEGEGEGEGKGPIEEEAPGETTEVYGTLVSIEDEAEGVCFITFIDNEDEGRAEVLYPAPDLCGKGYEDYLEYDVALTIDAEGNAIELTTMSPD